MEEEGIRINDVAAEISPGGLESILQKTGAAVRVTRLDCSVSEAAVNALMRKFGPPETASTAEVSDGRFAVEQTNPKGQFRLELLASGLKVEITADGIRLRTEGQE